MGQRPKQLEMHMQDSRLTADATWLVLEGTYHFLLVVLINNLPQITLITAQGYHYSDHSMQ